MREKDIQQLKATCLGLVIAVIIGLGALWLKVNMAYIDAELWKDVSTTISVIGMLSVMAMFSSGKWVSQGFLSSLFLAILWPIPWSFYIAGRIIYR